MAYRYKEPEKDRKVIEQGGRGMTYVRTYGFTVYGLGTYPRTSVLAGQQRRTFIDSYDTLEAAKQAHPDAKFIPGTSYQKPDLSHLRDEEE